MMVQKFVSLSVWTYLFLKKKHGVKPFSTNIPFLYPLKTSENLRVSDVFRGYRGGTLVENGLKAKASTGMMG